MDYVGAVWTAPGQARSVSVVDQPAMARHAGLVGSLREREPELAAVEVLRFRDGQHASFNLMYDRLLMLEQLGLIPAAASRPPR